MVSREIIDDIITKCTLADKLRSFQKNRDNYYIEDVSLDPIEVTPQLKVTDEKEIKNIKGIATDKYGTLYGAMEMRQDSVQKRINYTPNEFGAVNNYSCNEYKLINGQIYGTDYYKQRKKDSPNIDEWVNMRKENLDSAIKKSPPLVMDTTLYRYGDFPSGLKVGDTGKFKGYTSTTYQEKTSEKFKKGYDGKEEGRYKITIRSPAGTKGVLLNDTFEAIKEHEWLLPRNQKWMVLSVNDETREVEIGLY